VVKCGFCKLRMTDKESPPRRRCQQCSALGWFISNQGLSLSSSRVTRRIQCDRAKRMGHISVGSNDTKSRESDANDCVKIWGDLGVGESRCDFWCEVFSGFEVGCGYGVYFFRRSNGFGLESLWKWCEDSAALFINFEGLLMILIQSVMLSPARIKISKGQGCLLQTRVGSYIRTVNNNDFMVCRCKIIATWGFIRVYKYV
jgi:hypothetical protein